MRKLTQEDVIIIKQLIAEREEHRRKVKNITNLRIAEKFGVHERTIDRISDGTNWQGVGNG